MLKTRRKPIRVLHIIQGKHFGGAEQVVLTLSKCFDRSQVMPSVVCLSKGLLLEKLGAANIPNFLIPMKSKTDIIAPLYKTMRLIKKKHIDIIHTHTFRSNLVGRLAAVGTLRKCVTHLHSPILRDFADLRRGRINETIDRMTRPIAARYIAVSHSLRKEMIQRGLAPRKILTVHNVPDLDSLKLSIRNTGSKPNVRQEYHIPQNAFLLVLVALLRPRKGVEVLIKAMKKVLQYFPDTRLLLVGSDDISEDPDYGNRLRRLTTELGLESNVAFAGFRDDVPEILSQSDLMVLPSLFGEGLPMVILEAMAMGVAVIASRVEGIPEIIVDGKDGFLVEPGDSDQLSNKIIQLLKDPVLLQDVRQSAREKMFREMNAQRHARQIEYVYQEVLKLEVPKMTKMS